MSDRPIRVTVFKPTGKPNYFAQWLDRETGRKRTQSTGTPNHRDALRFGDRLEKRLNDGTPGTKRTTWEEFKRRVDDEFYPEKRPSTATRYRSTLSIVEQTLNPKLLTGINAAAIVKLKAALRERGYSPATIAAELRHLKSILRWSQRHGMLTTVPHIEIRGTEAPARGRPLTEREFLRMLAAAKSITGERCESWRHLLRGLWLSGLRVSEAMAATWDDRDGIRVDLDGPFPAIHIPGRLQKSRRNTVTPLTPDFVEFLAETPKADRRGFVFSPAAGGDTKSGRITAYQVGRTIAAIGKRSRVVTKREPLEHATAHDLRRSFCFRWSQRVLPQVLMALARHSSVSTTLTYYAASDASMTAQAVADALRKT